MRPLTAALLVSLLAHALALPALHRAITQPNNPTSPHALAHQPDQPPTHTNPAQPKPPAPPEITLGSNTAPDRTAVAWISYDTFQELRARRSRTEQPALQKLADPTPNAPFEHDPTDPAPLPSPDRLADSSNSSDQPTDTPATITQLAALPPAEAQPLIPLPDPTPAPRVINPTSASTNQPRIPTPTDSSDLRPIPIQPAPQLATASPITQTNPPPAPASPDANPTAAPRDDREADPTSATRDDLLVKTGQVLTARGLEIKTAHVRPSVVTRSSTIPHNPVVRVTFDTQGRVINAAFIRSTGYANWDAPVLASLYQWRATGDRLADFTEPFSIKVDLILIPE